jgi:hypothetical protein
MQFIGDFDDLSDMRRGLFDDFKVRNFHPQQSYSQIVKECQKAGQKFKDTVFPPNDNSLFRTQNPAPPGGKVEWKRISVSTNLCNREFERILNFLFNATPLNKNLSTEGLFFICLRCPLFRLFHLERKCDTFLMLLLLSLLLHSCSSVDTFTPTCFLSLSLSGISLITHSLTGNWAPSATVQRRGGSWRCQSRRDWQLLVRRWIVPHGDQEGIAHSHCPGLARCALTLLFPRYFDRMCWQPVIMALKLSFFI